MAATSKDIPWVRTFIAMGASLIKGVEPHAAADTIDRATRSRGGDPREIWRVVYRLAAERLDLLDPPLAACGCVLSARRVPVRCLSCGGETPQIRTVQET